MQINWADQVDFILILLAVSLYGGVVSYYRRVYTKKIEHSLWVAGGELMTAVFVGGFCGLGALVFLKWEAPSAVFVAAAGGHLGSIVLNWMETVSRNKLEQHFKIKLSKKDDDDDESDKPNWRNGAD